MEMQSLSSDQDRVKRHDLTNHLSAIRGYADLLLRDTPLTDPRRADMEEIRESAIAALELVGRMEPNQVDTTR